MGNCEGSRAGDVFGLRRGSEGGGPSEVLTFSIWGRRSALPEGRQKGRAETHTQQQWKAVVIIQRAEIRLAL